MAPPKTKTGIGTRAPVTELGGVLGGALSPAGMAPWTKFVDHDEFVPELVWPRSTGTYNQMRADSQVSALYKATVLGVSKFKWSIDPNDCDEKMVDKYSRDYNLPILGITGKRPRLRQKRRFAFKAHMLKAFKAGIYGHYPFEQVGAIHDDDEMWHLRKLAERPPNTIQDFRVAEDGGLISIIQNIPRGGRYWGELPEIPVDRLVMYVWEQEGANWAGRSWFRDCFKNWVIKDRLLRIDAVNHERAGGVPYIEAHPGASFAEIEQLNAMAQGFRIGDTAGGAVPAGAKVQIAKGTNSSVIESIKYHDEAMARNWMLMIMQLGMTESGSRALGTTFIDFWGHGLASIADWFKDTFNEHVLEDDVDWNYGEEVDQVPLLTYEYDPEFVIQDLATAVENGVIETDDDLEHYARKEMGLPEKGVRRMNPKVDRGTANDPAVNQTQTTNADGSQQPTATARAVRAEGAPSRRARPSVHPEQLAIHE
jgi:hypothetical protein